MFFKIFSLSTPKGVPRKRPPRKRGSPRLSEAPPLLRECRASAPTSAAQAPPRARRQRSTPLGVEQAPALSLFINYINKDKKGRGGGIEKNFLSTILKEILSRCYFYSISSFSVFFSYSCHI